MRATLLVTLLAAVPGVASAGPFSHHGQPMLTPTLSAGLGYALSAGGEQVPVCAGIAFYPELGRGVLAPRLGLLLDLGIQLAEAGRGTHVSFTPTLHSGLAFLIPSSGEKARFGRALFPFLHLYAIVGVRIPGERDGLALPTAIRLGLGLSSPLLSLLTLALARAGAAVPNLVELTADLEPSTRRVGWLFKLGVGL